MVDQWQFGCVHCGAVRFTESDFYRQGFDPTAHQAVLTIDPAHPAATTMRDVVIGLCAACFEQMPSLDLARISQQLHQSESHFCQVKGHPQKCADKFLGVVYTQCRPYRT